MSAQTGGAGTAPAPPAKLDPEVVKQFAGWRERLPAGSSLGERLNKLDKMITYIPTMKGVKEVRKTPFGYLIKEPKEVLVGGLEADLPTGLTLGVPRLPWHLFAQTVAFFRHVNDKSKAEVLIRFYFDRQDGGYVPFVPPQEVSGGSVKVDDKRELVAMELDHARYLHVFDIHSHNTMSAFWSAVDDADEKQNVRLYGVIGQIGKKIPATKWRMWSGHEFIDLDFDQVVDAATIELPVAVNLGITMKNAAGDKGADTLPVTFNIDPFEGVGFPAEWMEHVTTRTYVTGGGTGFRFHRDLDDEPWMRWHRGFSDPGAGSHDARSVGAAGGGSSSGKIFAYGREFADEGELNKWLAGDRTVGRPVGAGVTVASLITQGLDMANVPRHFNTLTKKDLAEIASGDVFLYRVEQDEVFRYVPASDAWASTHLKADDVFAYRHRASVGSNHVRIIGTVEEKGPVKH